MYHMFQCSSDAFILLALQEEECTRTWAFLYTFFAIYTEFSSFRHARMQL